MNIAKMIIRYELTDIDIIEVTLLSKDEYEETYSNIVPVNEWWWLRSPGSDQYYAAIVFPDGSLNYCNVYNTLEAVRPALKIRNLASSSLKIKDKFTLMGYVWTVISDDTALCDDCVGYTYFRKDWQASDANVYETSDVKKWLENWAKDVGIEVSDECG